MKGEEKPWDCGGNCLATENIITKTLHLAISTPKLFSDKGQSDRIEIKPNLQF